MKFIKIFFISLILWPIISCTGKGSIIILNGPPCAGKTTTAIELQKLLPKSKIVRLDDIQKKAIFELGIKLGIFTAENQQGPDNKYGYNGLGHFIQYVRDHRACTDQEFNELLGLRLQPFKQISSLAQEGTTVIFDGVVSQANDRLDECIEIFRGNEITFALLYLPFEATAERYANSGRGHHGILHVFGYNYPWFYRIQEKKNEPALEQFSYQKIVSVIENLGQKIPLPLQKQCIEEVASRLQLSDKEKQVILTPRMRHDLILDAEQLSAQDCAQKIAEHIDASRNKTTVFFDNRFLPKPSTLEILTRVPKFSIDTKL